MSKEYKDRFNKASEELPEKNAFVCKSCKKTYKKEEAQKQEMACCDRTLTELMQEGFGP